MDMYDQVRARGLHNAVVIVHSGGGAYMPFTPKDLTRNGIEIGDQDVIYALDIPGRVSELGDHARRRTCFSPFAWHRSQWRASA